MIEKVKTWCEYEFKNATRYNANPLNAMTRCYGIIMFVSNSLLEYDSVEGKELTT